MPGCPCFMALMARYEAVAGGSGKALAAAWAADLGMSREEASLVDDLMALREGVGQL